MASTIKIGMEVSDNGQLKNLTKDAKNLRGELTAAQKAAKSIGVGAASGRMGPSKEENIAYRNARGVAGTGGGGSRDFAKQSQGLGGLVHLYATFAANIFAVSAAFMALDKAAQYTQMIEGAKALEASTGAALRNIADNMKDVTDGALSMQESLRLTSLGSAAGLSSKKILELTKGAKGASLALGRDMGDSIDRVIRGVAKLEPELLDELGVVTRAQEAYKNYAKSIGVSTDALTSYQKTVAYSSAVSEELTRKFGAIADKVPANPYAKFLGQLKDVGTELLGMVNNVITPVVSAISDNVELMVAGVLLVVKSLTTRAIPEIGKLFTVSPDAIAKQQAHLKELEGQRTKYFEVQKAQALAQKDTLLAIKKKELAELVSVEQAGLAKIQSFVKSNYRKTNSTGAAAILGSTDLKSLQENVSAKKSLAAKEMATRRALDKAILEDTAASTALTQKKVVLLRAELGQVEAINKSLMGQVSESKAILNLKTQISQINSKDLIIETEMTKRTALRTELLRTQAVVAKQERNARLAAAEFNFGKDSDRYRSIESTTKKRVATTTIRELQNNPIFASDKPGERLNKLGEAAFRGKMGMLALSEGIATVGKTLGTVISFLSIWGVAAMILWEVISFGANKLGLLNNKTDELNKTLDEGTKVLEAAVSASKKYSAENIRAKGSIDSLVSANTILSNSFDQITTAITDEMALYKEWMDSATVLSTFWDNLFGKTRFEKLQDLISGQISAAAKMATGVDKERLNLLAEAVKGAREDASGEKELNRIKQESLAILTRVSEAKKIESSRVRDLQQGYLDAGAALETFNKKQVLKDSNLRTISQTVTQLEKLLSDSSVSEVLKLEALDALPENIASLDSTLLKAWNRAKEEITSRKVLADAEARLLEQRTAQEERYNLSRTQINLLEVLSREELLAKEDELSKLRETYVAGARADALEKELKFVKDRIKETEQAAKEIERLRTESTREQVRIWDEAFTKAGGGFVERMLSVFPWIRKDSQAIQAADAAVKAVSEAEKNRKDKAMGTRYDRDNVQQAPLWNPGQTSRAIDRGFTAEATDSAGNIKDAAGALPNVQGKLSSLDTKDKASRANKLEKEMISQALDFLKASETLQVQLNKTQEENLGYTTQDNIEKLVGIRRATVLMKTKEEEADILEKYKNASKDLGITDSQRAVLRDEALATARLELGTQWESISAAEKELLIASELKSFDVKKGYEYEKQNTATEQNILLLKSTAGASARIIDDMVQQLELSKLIQVEEKAKLSLAQENSGIIDKQNYERAKQNRINKEALIDETKSFNLRADTLKAIDMYNEQLSVGQAIQEKMYPDAMINKAFLLQKYELDLLKLRTEYQQNADKNLAGSAELLALKEKQLEVEKNLAVLEQNKRLFLKLSIQEQKQTIYDEADRQSRDFATGVTDVVTGTFNSIYSGMDAALDTLADKMMRSEDISFRELVQTFRNTAAEAFRDLSAEYMKLTARDAVKNILGSVFDINLDTKEETAAKEAAVLMEGMSVTQDNMYGRLTDINDNLYNMYSDGIILRETGALTKAKADTPEMNKGVSVEGIKKNVEAEVKGVFNRVLTSLGDKFKEVFGEGGIVRSGFIALGNWINKLISNALSSISGSSSSSGGGGILGTLFQVATSYFTGGTSSAGLEAAGGSFSPLTNYTPIGGPSIKFADGGIMSEYGPLKLNKYASGGIANSPQVAVYGEGSTPEAYVPLPDGRSIPVSMTGGTAQEGDNVNINITINSNGGLDAGASSSNKDSGAQFAQFSQLIAGKVREEMVKQKRPGGLLFNGGAA